MQIFTKNNNRWYSKELSDKEIEIYKTRLEASNIKFVVAHDSYLINLCAKDLDMLIKSRNSFIDELKRCELLGISHLLSSSMNEFRDSFIDELKRCELLGISHLNFHPG